MKVEVVTAEHTVSQFVKQKKALRIDGFNKGCPYNSFLECGDWCALFEHITQEDKRMGSLGYEKVYLHCGSGVVYDIKTFDATYNTVNAYESVKAKTDDEIIKTLSTPPKPVNKLKQGDLGL